MLPHYIGECEPKQIIIALETAREFLMKEGDEMFVRRRFERIYNRTEVNSYAKYEANPENKEIFIYGFKRIKTDKVRWTIWIC